MLSEEALILLTACAGLGLLILGIWQHLSPVRPRHPERPSPPPADGPILSGDGPAEAPRGRRPPD